MKPNITNLALLDFNASLQFMAEARLLLARSLFLPFNDVTTGS
jgi:hypothetical protein